MMIGYIEKSLIDEVFKKKEEQRSVLEIAMTTENKAEEESSWNRVREIEKEIDEFIDKRFVYRIVDKWEHLIFKLLFKAVGDFGKDKFLKTLEVYEIGVKDDEDNEERTSIAN